MGPTWFDETHMNFNQSKMVCWKVCVRKCVAVISYDIYLYTCYSELLAKNLFISQFFFRPQIIKKDGGV